MFFLDNLVGLGYKYTQYDTHYTGDLSIICTFDSYHSITINNITYINMISVVPKQDGSIHIKYILDFLIQG